MYIHILIHTIKVVLSKLKYKRHYKEIKFVYDVKYFNYIYIYKFTIKIQIIWSRNKKNVSWSTYYMSFVCRYVILTQVSHVRKQC